jgi:putative transposase
MDFVNDALIDGRALRVLMVIDQCSGWTPILKVASSMSGESAAQAFDRVIAKHRKPIAITVDHGTEFTSRGLNA